MTPIASMVATMIARGVDPEMIALAVSTAEMAVEMAVSNLQRPPDIHPTKVDRTTENRRAWDREYRRRKRVCPPESTRHPPDIHPTTENAPLSISKKEEEKKERKRERGTQLPPDWRPGERAWQGAVARVGVPRAELELGKFRNHAADKGRISKSWDAAWNNWIDRSIVYEAQNGRRKTVHDAAKDFHENVLAKLRQFDEPAPSSLCEREGADVVRLLPAGRRE